MPAEAESARGESHRRRRQHPRQCGHRSASARREQRDVDRRAGERGRQSGRERRQCVRQPDEQLLTQEGIPTMILYYSPGACSQAPHILLHEIGLSHDAKRVDLSNKTLEDGSSYLDINPKGAVPALGLENGEVLTENAVVLQYLGDRSGAADVLPAVGRLGRYRVLELVNYITTEVHKSFGPLFSPEAGEETKQYMIANLGKKFDYLEKVLDKGPFLLGDELTLPDPYLF